MSASHFFGRWTSRTGKEANGKYIAEQEAALGIWSSVPMGDNIEQAHGCPKLGIYPTPPVCLSLAKSYTRLQVDDNGTP